MLLFIGNIWLNILQKQKDCQEKRRKDLRKEVFGMSLKDIAMEKGDEIIVLSIERKAFIELYNQGLIDLKSSDFILKEVKINDEEYPDDPQWRKLKAESIRAYKDLKDYEFLKRHEK